MNFLLGFTDETPAWLHEFLKPDVLVFLVPISAILGGIGLGIVKVIIHHRERMAKIEHGIDPDANPPKDPPDHT